MSTGSREPRNELECIFAAAFGWKGAVAAAGAEDGAAMAAAGDDDGDWGDSE